MRFSIKQINGCIKLCVVVFYFYSFVFSPEISSRIFFIQIFSKSVFILFCIMIYWFNSRWFQFVVKSVNYSIFWSSTSHIRQHINNQFTILKFSQDRREFGSKEWTICFERGERKRMVTICDHILHKNLLWSPIDERNAYNFELKILSKLVFK